MLDLGGLPRPRLEAVSILSRVYSLAQWLSASSLYKLFQRPWAAQGLKKGACGGVGNTWALQLPPAMHPPPALPSLTPRQHTSPSPFLLRTPAPLNSPEGRWNLLPEVPSKNPEGRARRKSPRNTPTHRMAEAQKERARSAATSPEAKSGPLSPDSTKAQ